MKRKKEKEQEKPVAARACQLRSTASRPFGMLRSFVPLGTGEERIYRQLREAIPVLDAAVGKLIRLTGGFGVQCQNSQAQKKLEAFFGPCSLWVRSGGHPQFLGRISGQSADLR